jgi:membrane protein DedA with SNARE-associated domain
MESILALLCSFVERNELLAYAIIFLISIPEGPKLTAVCGVMSTRGLLNPFIVYMLVVFGDMIGDSVWYIIGRFGEKILPWLGPKIGLTKENFNDAQKYFEARHMKALLFSKFAYGPGVVGLVFAGSIKYPYRKYILGCSMISLGQSLVWLTLGIFAGNAYIRIEHYLNMYVAIASCIAILVFGFLSIRWVLSKTEEKGDAS